MKREARWGGVGVVTGGMGQEGLRLVVGRGVGIFRVGGGLGGREWDARG